MATSERHDEDFLAEIDARAVIEPNEFGERLAHVRAYEIDTPTGPYLITEHHALWPIMRKQFECAGIENAEFSLGMAVET